MSARVGLGTKAGLAANDRRSEVPLSQAVLGRDGSVLGPDIETFFIFPEPEETGEHHDQAAGPIRICSQTRAMGMQCG